MLQGNSGCQHNYWHPGHKYKAHFRIKIFLFHRVQTPVDIASALFQIYEGSKIIEAFRIAKMLLRTALRVS